MAKKRKTKHGVTARLLANKPAARQAWKQYHRRRAELRAAEDKLLQDRLDQLPQLTAKLDDQSRAFGVLLGATDPLAKASNRVRDVCWLATEVGLEQAEQRLLEDWISSDAVEDYGWLRELQSIGG